MGVFLDIKRQARQAVHDVMSRPALYIPNKAFPLINAPITVRVYDSWGLLGNLKGTSFHYAEREEVSPQIKFWYSEVVPIRGAVIMLEAGLGYQVDHLHPRDDQTILADVIKLTVAETAGLPYPT